MEKQWSKFRRSSRFYWIFLKILCRKYFFQIQSAKWIVTPNWIKIIRSGQKSSLSKFVIIFKIEIDTINIIDSIIAYLIKCQHPNDSSWMRENYTKSSSTEPLIYDFKKWWTAQQQYVLSQKQNKNNSCLRRKCISIGKRI